jgi:hypothetical protein
LSFCGDGKSDHSRHPGIQELCNPFDGSALAGGVTALEEDDETGTHRLDPLLHLHQLGLEPGQFRLVSGGV